MVPYHDILNARYFLKHNNVFVIVGNCYVPQRKLRNGVNPSIVDFLLGCRPREACAPFSLNLAKISSHEVEWGEPFSIYPTCWPVEGIQPTLTKEFTSLPWLLVADVRIWRPPGIYSEEPTPLAWAFTALTNVVSTFWNSATIWSTMLSVGTRRGIASLLAPASDVKFFKDSNRFCLEIGFCFWILLTGSHWNYCFNWLITVKLWILGRIIGWLVFGNDFLCYQLGSWIDRVSRRG